MKIAMKPDEVKNVGLVGAGVIGCGWAAHFLARGLNVVATDPHPEAEKRMREMVKRSWPALEQLGLAEGASQDRLTFVPSIPEVLTDIDFVQESTPEDEALKTKVMQVIDEATRPDVVIASSTSGFLPSNLQAHCKNPERVLVGHPFNPVYLMPLIEVVGGDKTTPETIAWTMAFYKYLGHDPLHCRTEVEGHLGGRFQVAVLNEMLHMVEEGVATTDELDAALCCGAGMRWALLGAFMTVRSNCGDKPIRTTLEAWLPIMKLSRSKLAGPEMTPALIDNLVAGMDGQAQGHSAEELCAMRDEFLVGVVKLRKQVAAKYGFSQGRFQEQGVLQHHET